MVDLKTFWDMAMSNQSCLDVTKQMSSWFLGDILGLKFPNLNDSYMIIICFH